MAEMVSEKAMAELRGLSAGWRDAANGWRESGYDGRAYTYVTCAEELEATIDKLSKENDK